jgi:hypothetical protein
MTCWFIEIENDNKEGVQVKNKAQEKEGRSSKKGTRKHQSC